MKRNTLTKSGAKQKLKGKLEKFTLEWRSGEMKSKVVMAILAMLLLASVNAIAKSACAKPPVNTWINMNPSTAPPARGDVNMVYDSKNKVVVLFGGGSFWTQYCQYFGDTWTYNLKTNTWTNMNPAVAPDARTFHAMAYDSDNGVVVLYGGVGNDHPSAGSRHDTWIYNVKTNTWTNMNPSNPPQLDAGCAMAYDSRHRKMVLYGLHPWPSEEAEMWTYDVSANTWTQITPLNWPPPMRPANMEYDAANRVMVTLYYNTVWTYSLDTNTWTQKDPATQPPNRWNGPDALAYDSKKERMILFGGWGDPMHDDTWTYDVKTNTWTDISPSTSPPSRGSHGIAYDSKNNAIVIFGGESSIYYDPTQLQSDTWIYIKG